MFRVVLSEEAQSDLRKLNPLVVSKIYEAFRMLQIGISVGQKMHEDVEGYYRIIASDVVIIFRKDSKERVIYVTAIDAPWQT